MVTKIMKGLVGILASASVVGVLGYNPIMDTIYPSRAIVREMANQTSFKIDGDKLEARFGKGDACIVDGDGNIIYTLVKDGETESSSEPLVNVGSWTLAYTSNPVGDIQNAGTLGRYYRTYQAICTAPNKKCYLVVKSKKGTSVAGLEGEVNKEPRERILKNLK